MDTCPSCRSTAVEPIPGPPPPAGTAELHASLLVLVRKVAALEARLSEQGRRLEATAVRVAVLAAPAIDLGPFGPGDDFDGPTQLRLNGEFSAALAKVATILDRLDGRVGALERGCDDGDGWKSGGD
jgi:hypothetical protein